MSSYDLIDDEAICQLMELDDNNEFAKEILDEYFAQLENKLPELEQLVARSDYVNAGKLGHYLKGSSAGVGAARIRDICEHLQHYDHETQDPGSFFHHLVQQLKDAIPDTKLALYGKVGL
jgi:HPt (histidine-containing phosphotransfer) domain-containing protein